MKLPKYEKMYDDFINRYEEIHVCPWHEMSKEQTEALYLGYISNNDVLDDYQYYYMANYIVTRLSGISDAHTTVNLKNTGSFPYLFKIIDGEVFVVGVFDEEELLLSKLVSINGIDINKIIAEIANIIPCGNEGWLRFKVENFLPSIGNMLSLPSLHGEPAITYNFIDKNGNRVDKEYNTYEKFYRKTNKRIDIPIRHDNLYFEFNGDAIYFVYNSCLNDACVNMKKVLDELDFHLLNGHYNRFIIDLRNNAGGNSNNNLPIIDFLKRHDELEIITLTNNATFSSGRFMYEALRNLGTIAIGEEPGTPINAFGNAYIKEKEDNRKRRKQGLEQLQSTIVHKISSRYFYFDEEYKLHIAMSKKEYDDMPNAWKITDFNPPDIEIKPTLEDYINNRDSVMEYAIKREYNKVNKER